MFTGLIGLFLAFAFLASVKTYWPAYEDAALAGILIYALICYLMLDLPIAKKWRSKIINDKKLICDKCKSIVNKKDKYCHHCGSKLYLNLEYDNYWVAGSYDCDGNVLVTISHIDSDHQLRSDPDNTTKNYIKKKNAQFGINIYHDNVSKNIYRNKEEFKKFVIKVASDNMEYFFRYMEDEHNFNKNNKNIWQSWTLIDPNPETWVDYSEKNHLKPGKQMKIYN